SAESAGTPTTSSWASRSRSGSSAIADEAVHSAVVDGDEDEEAAAEDEEVAPPVSVPVVDPACGVPEPPAAPEPHPVTTSNSSTPSRAGMTESPGLRCGTGVTVRPGSSRHGPRRRALRGSRRPPAAALAAPPSARLPSHREYLPASRARGTILPHPEGRRPRYRRRAVTSSRRGPVRRTLLDEGTRP